MAMNWPHLTERHGWQSLKQLQLPYWLTSRACSQRFGVGSPFTQPLDNALFLDGTSVCSVRESIESYRKPIAPFKQFFRWLASFFTGLRTTYALLVVHELCRFEQIEMRLLAENFTGEFSKTKLGIARKDYQTRLERLSTHPFAEKFLIKEAFTQWVLYIASLLQQVASRKADLNNRWVRDKALVLGVKQQIDAACASQPTEVAKEGIKALLNELKRHYRQTSLYLHPDKQSLNLCDEEKARITGLYQELNTLFEESVQIIGKWAPEVVGSAQNRIQDNDPWMDEIHHIWNETQGLCLALDASTAAVQAEAAQERAEAAQERAEALTRDKKTQLEFTIFKETAAKREQETQEKIDRLTALVENLLEKQQQPSGPQAGAPRIEENSTACLLPQPRLRRPSLFLEASAIPIAEVTDLASATNGSVIFRVS